MKREKNFNAVGLRIKEVNLKYSKLRKLIINYSTLL